MTINPRDHHQGSLIKTHKPTIQDDTNIINIAWDPKNHIWQTSWNSCFLICRSSKVPNNFITVIKFLNVTSRDRPTHQQMGVLLNSLATRGPITGLPQRINKQKRGASLNKPTPTAATLSNLSLSHQLHSTYVPNPSLITLNFLSPNKKCFMLPSWHHKVS